MKVIKFKDLSKSMIEKAKLSTNETLRIPNEFEDSKPPTWKRYMVGLACVSIAFAVRYSLTPVLGEEMPFMLFIAASLVASWYGGATSGILVLLFGLFLADYVFLSNGRKGVSDWAEVFYFLRYVFTSLLGVILIEVLHRGRRELQREISSRKGTEHALVEAQRQLRQHADLLEMHIEERTARLSDSVRYLQDLLYQIAHNLRAPARAIGGLVSILLEEQCPKLDDNARRYCEEALTASKRMDAMILDLLEYGRLGHMDVSLGNVRLDQEVEEALARLASEIQTRHAKVVVEKPLPQVRADAEVLADVLFNLLENALRFVGTGIAPHVRIFSQRSSGRIRLWIQDNGIGIDPRYHETIFRPFEVLDPHGNHGGTGMGLAIVKEGMQRMGGQTGVESQPGGGSRFWLELPVATAGDPTSDASLIFCSNPCRTSSNMPLVLPGPETRR